MATDDVWQLQLLQRYAGQQIMNTLAFRTKAATVVDAAAGLALANDWKDALRPLQVNTMSYFGWVLQQVRGGTAAYPTGLCRRDGGLRLEGSFTGTLTGTSVNPGMPPQSAIVTTLKSGFSGRRRRGRMYFAGWDRGNEDAGTVTAAFVTSLNTMWATQMTKFGPGGTSPLWQLGIWSMRTATGCAPAVAHPHHMNAVDSPDPAGAYLDCVSVTPRAIVYSQRKRTIGVGR